MLASTPGRCAARPAAPTKTSTPRPSADATYSRSVSGCRCALMTDASQPIPYESSTSKQPFSEGRSEREPQITATRELSVIGAARIRAWRRSGASQARNNGVHRSDVAEQDAGDAQPFAQHHELLGQALDRS